MKYLQLLLVLALAAILSSCATVLTGTTQRVTIDSTPPGAKIIVDGYLMGTTPARVRLDRDFNAIIDDGKDISLELEGFYTDGYFLRADIEPTTILNVFCPFGFALDVVSGAIMRYDSDYYNFRLLPIESAPVQPGSQSDQNVSEMSDYAKLIKLVELYEDGYLTEVEFESEKAKIFNRKPE
jgi:uncharacterized protein YceK